MRNASDAPDRVVTLMSLARSGVRTMLTNAQAILCCAGQLITPAMEHSVVPQQSNGLPYRLSTIERQELELARRRAEKAAEGKRANAAQARAKRRASRPRPDDRQSEQGDGGEGSNGEEDDLEAKLANTKDEKEAKRLRR